MQRLSPPIVLWPISLLVVVASLLASAWWANQQVERSLVEASASQAALAISRWMAPPLPELSEGQALTPAHIAMLQSLVGTAPQGQPIVAFKVWSPAGRIIYGTDPALVGQSFPVKGELERALRGETVYDLSDLTDSENILERGRWQRLLEIYNPVTKPGTTEVTAVIEFYQTVDNLEAAARQAQTNNWLLFGGAAGGALLLLAAFVRQDSRSVTRQQSALERQIAGLRVQLAQAEKTLVRQRHGVAGLIMLHEQAWQQFQQDFNAGPAQNLCYTLLEFEQAIDTAKQPATAVDSPRYAEHLRAIDYGLRLSYRELAGLIKSLPSPILDQKSLAETLQQAAAVYQQRTGLGVELELGPLPAAAPGFLKATLYRLLQAALAATVAGAVEARQRGRISYEDSILRLEFGHPQTAAANPAAAQARLIEIRSRVESLGGRLVEAASQSAGAHVLIEIPWSASELGWS